MRKQSSFFVSSILIFAMSFFTACGGSGGGGTTPPSPQILVTISPTSVTLQFGQTQQFTATVTGTSNTSVAWSLIPAFCGTVSASGFYAASNSAGTCTVTATSQADTTKSASASITVTKPPQVTVAPMTATVLVGSTQQFTANQDVDWFVNGIQSGNSVLGTIGISGSYTAPQLPPNPASVTVKACSRTDSTNCATASATIVAGPGSFSWLNYYAPKNGTALGKAVVVVPSSGEVVAGVDSVPQGSSDPQAAFVAYGKDGSLLGNWANSAPSNITAMTFYPATGNVFATGYAGTSANPDGHSALIFAMSPSDPTNVVLDKQFQFDANGNVVMDGSGLRTEAVAISVQNGKIYLAVKSDYELCGLAFGACSGDWIVTADLQGNVLGKFAVGNTTFEKFSDKTEIAGLLVLSDHLWVTGNWFAKDNAGVLRLAGVYVEKWSPNSQLIAGPYILGPSFNAGPVEELVNGSIVVADTFFNDNNSGSSNTYFDLTGFAADLMSITFSRIWDGDNGGGVFTNLDNGGFVNNGTDIVVVGSLSKIGSDPHVSDGGAISWATDGQGSNGGALLWKKRFDLVPLGTVSSWNGGSSAGEGSIVLVGSGSDGNTVCGATTACGTAVVGKWLTPQ